MMNSMVPTTAVQNQEQVYYNSEEPEINNYEMYLHKQNVIDENTIQTIPEDKKEELYKKYETFDSQGELYEMNQIQNHNPITFGNNVNKETHEIESIHLQTLDENNKLRNYNLQHNDNDNDNVDEYLGEEDNIAIISTGKKNIVNESPQFEQEEENGSQIEQVDNNNIEQRDLNIYMNELNQQNVPKNNEDFNEMENEEEQNEYIQDGTDVDNNSNVNNPSTNQIESDIPMIKNKVKKYLFNNKISESNLEQNQYNITNNNPNTNIYTYNNNFPERNISPIINQYSKSQQNIQSKEPELQLEISQLKAQISSLQNKYDLLTRELQAEKAKNDLLQIKSEQTHKIKENENDTLKQIAKYLNVQQNEDILPKITEIVSNMNKLNLENNKKDINDLIQPNQNIPEKIKKESQHYSNLNDTKIKDELISKLKTLCIELSGNEDTHDVDIKAVWRWIKHLIHTVKELAQEKEKNAQMILELQDACVFRDFCLDLMQEINVNDLNELKQVIYQNFQMQEVQPMEQNISIGNQKGNSGMYTYQHQEQKDDNYMNLNRGNYNNMNNYDYQHNEDDNHY